MRPMVCPDGGSRGRRGGLWRAYYSAESAKKHRRPKSDGAFSLQICTVNWLKRPADNMLSMTHPIFWGTTCSSSSSRPDRTRPGESGPYWVWFLYNIYYRKHIRKGPTPPSG